MKRTKIILGAIAGFSLGYVAVRALQSAAALRGATLQPSHDAATYGRTQRALALCGTLRGAAASLAFAYGPTARAFERALSPLPPWLRPGAFFAGLSLASALVDAPVALVEDHLLEHKYALSAQTLRSFAVDYAKGAALGSAVAAGLAILGGLIVASRRRSWPIVAALGMLPLFILANLVVPIYILPLFNRFEPLRGSLEVRLRALATRFGVGGAEILRMDMSKQTKKANAFVAGIGSTHRIVLGDTLIDAFEPDEIEFVVAHELGHYVTRDTWRMIALAETVTEALLGQLALVTRDDRKTAASYCVLLRGWAPACSPCGRRSTPFRVRANGPRTGSPTQRRRTRRRGCAPSSGCAIRT